MGFNVLLIGGSGFIGTAVSSRLVGSGRSASVVARSQNAPDGFGALLEQYPKQLRYLVGSAGDEAFVRQAIEGHSHIVYLAHTWPKPLSAGGTTCEMASNFEQAKLVFRIAAEVGKGVILISTGGALYGEAGVGRIPESNAVKPVSEYGLTKFLIENCADFYARTMGLDFVCLRPGNAYGIGQIPFTGQGFIATAIAKIIRGEPVQVFGRKGTVRDYIYIEDLADAIVSSIGGGLEEDFYNIGTGRGYSNDQILDELEPIAEKHGLRVFREYLPRRLQDVSRSVLDSDRFFKESGWQPQVSLAVGLDNTFSWLKGYLS